MVRTRFVAGQRVRVRPSDTGGHTRAPRYVRGHVGSIVEPQGVHARADDVAAGREPPRQETVYTVVFHAASLFGHGDHEVTVDLWEHYLEPAGQDPP